MQSDHLLKNNLRVFYVSKITWKHLKNYLKIMFYFFHVFFKIKVLNITSVEKNRDMHIFYRKKVQS